MKAKLVLEDGSSYDGVSIGAQGERIGEVVMNTAVVGYQEMMTDPANAGKILVLTYPLIGNYGIAEKFYESKRCRLAGLIIKEESRIYSNWQAQTPFGDFLKKEDVVAITDLDTRTLAVNIRDNGEMHGIISTGGVQSENDLVAKIKAYKKENLPDFIKDISVKKPTEVNKGASGPNIAVLDLGMPNSFIKQLKTLGCNITLLPYSTEAGAILAMKLDGLVISSGPEEDASIPKIADTVKGLLGKIPIMGISTGHEVIGLALGAKLQKMKIGHRGVNYPVKGPDSFKGEITVQNHSYVIDDDSIKKKGVSITLRNINDNSIEAMESGELKFISTQYYPSSPGFDEVNEAFMKFVKMASARKKVSKEVQHAKT